MRSNKSDNMIFKANNLIPMVEKKCQERLKSPLPLDSNGAGGLSLHPSVRNFASCIFLITTVETE
jgi:hypothetical protein